MSQREKHLIAEQEAKRKKEEYNNLEWLKNMLQEAEKNLSDAKKLQESYPESFGVKIMISGWKNHIQELKQKIEKGGSEEEE